MEPSAEVLLKKIRELEASHARLKQDMSRLMPADGGARRADCGSHSVSPRRTNSGGGVEGSAAAWARGSSSSRLQRESRGPTDSPGGSPAGIRLSEGQCLNILQSLAQSVHIFDLEGRIIYWNRSAEELYGYTASEALGQNATELLVDACDFNIARSIVKHVNMGENWKGKFPVKNKLGEHFLVIATYNPVYDDDGSLVGIICVSSDSQSFQDSTYASTFSNLEASDTARKSVTNNGSLDPQQPLQITIASKITNLATKVTNKVRSQMKQGENNMEWETATEGSQCSDRDRISTDHKEDGICSDASTLRGEVLPCDFGEPSSVIEFKSPGKAAKVNNDEDEGKAGIYKIISKTEGLFANKGIVWPWKGNEQDATNSKTRFVWPWLHSNPENAYNHSKSSEFCMKSESQISENYRAGNNEASGSWSSLNVNSTSSISSCGSTSSSALHKVDTDCLDYEILWEDLTIGEQIGQGSCGTVYHALWYGSDVAAKVFSKQEYSDDVILSFRQEVSLMKRLRHPNMLLFMGAVTSPQRLCIVTEFLPRGSLFRLLQRNNMRLHWRRRINMALDIARGMNYLHHHNPPIIHSDLKSSNLLVDKNWTVKQVCDFGLSRLKHETYLTTKSGKGTPQWMAPEVLRNEHSDEKSDVYSYGVILWELATKKIPWENLNSVKIIATVGFMNQRLDLPGDLDPQWVSIIESCWHSEPKSRPTFQELVERLKEMQKQHAVQSHMQRAAAGARVASHERNKPD
ncbi:RGS domain-containing serine/threonine-protein kinase A-like isoform X1 [Zingiber officinale]|uniref:RGS domain-containing serine/threonine-protein kinase A-like isoform X1 n=1 Tax=Zingiber officinale TaxID=94328 RepID=UPI001C4D1555|nr:RGS domain-containing serine/threonine-protein kinase A-like isoform X1 [Zingiber officinale]